MANSENCVMGWSFNSGLECRGSMQQTSPLEPLNRHLDSHVLTPITLLKMLRHHNQCSGNLQPDQPATPSSLSPTAASPHCTGQICHCSSSDTPLTDLCEDQSTLSPCLNLVRTGSYLHSSPATVIPGSHTPATLTPLHPHVCLVLGGLSTSTDFPICWLWSLSSFLSHVTFYPRLLELQQVQASAMVYLLTPFKSTQLRAFIFWLYLSPHAHQLFCKESGLWLVQN